MATFNNGEAGLSVRTKLNNVLQHADGTTGTLTFNDAGADVDVRIEGVGQTHAFFLDGGTSNIGIGTSTATSKLTVAGDANVAGVATAIAMRDSTNRRITSPGGGSYTTATATVTGAIAITLPVGYTNHMVKMRISVFEYVTQESFDVIVSGYNYSTGPTWQTPSAYIVSNNATDRDFTVRFGFNASSSKCVIYIGELASTWSYPQVNITDVQLGYTTTGLDAWDDGWTVGFEASAFQNVTQTLTNNRVGARLIGTGQTTAALTDAGARSDMLRLSSVGTAAGTGGGIIFTNTQGDSANSVGMAAIKSLLVSGATNTTGDLAFSTRNAATDTALTERMRITSDGRVGIGMTPSASDVRLAVTGNVDIRAGSTENAFLEIGRGRTGDGASFVDLVGDTTYSDYGVRLVRNGGANGTTQMIVRGTGGLDLRTTDAGPIIFNTAAAERMRISAAGNVGIGTNSPSYLLDVAGSARFQTGIEAGNLQGYKDYNWLLDFGADVANTWRTLVDVGLQNTQYSTAGFKFDVVDFGSNHPGAFTADTIDLETYYVVCARTNDTVLDTPDACYVRGPGSRIRAVKTAVGTYEIQMQNDAQYREYRVNGLMYGVNGAHNVTYRYGTAASTGIAQYPAANSGGIYETFLNTATTGNVAIRAGIAVPTVALQVGVPASTTGALRANSTFVSVDAGYSATDVYGTAALPSLVIGGDLNTGVFHPAADSLAVSTNATERLRINSAGAVLIGTTAGRVGNGITPNLQLEGTTAAGTTIMATRNSADVNPSGIYLAKSRGAALGAVTAVTSGDQLGTINFLGADGTGLIQAAQIVASVDGTPGTNDMPGRLAFFTTPDGSASLVERMRIDNAGNIGLGMTPSVWGSNYKAIESLGNSQFVLAGANVNGIGLLSNGYADNTNFRYKTTAAAAYYSVNGATHQWYNASSGTAGNPITWNQVMSLDSTGIVNIQGMSIVAPSSGDTTLTISKTGVLNATIKVVNAALTFGLDGSGGGTERMRIDSVGNLGLGATPSSWVTGAKALEVGTGAGIVSRSGQNAEFIANAYLNSAINWIYRNSAPAAMYSVDNGHRWYIAPSGTAGNAITFTQAMTLDADGDLGIGISAPSAKLEVRGAALGGTAGDTSLISIFGATDANVSSLRILSYRNATGTSHTTSETRIQRRVDSTDMGYIGFNTTDTVFGTGASTELMRLTNAGRLAIGTATPAASAQLDVTSTTRGFLPPRMTTTERNAISSPAAGLTIYNTTTSREEGYDGAAWVPKVPLDIEEDRIINGGFDIWQRGASSTVSGYGAADRWVNEITGGTVTHSRQSFTVGDTLGMNSPLYFLRQSVTGQTLTSQYAITAQRIEGVRSYAGQTITILGWAKRATAGNIVIEGYQNFGTGGTPSAGVATSSPTTIALTTSWTPFAAVMTVPSISGKTLGTAGNDWFGILFWTSAGSDFNARTNSLGLQTTDVDFWGIHIREGVWNTADTLLYRQKSVVDELDKCYRYYYRVTADNGNARFAIGHNTSTTNAIGLTNFPVRMRIPPTALEQSGTGSQYAVYYLATGAASVNVPTFVQATYMTAMTQITLSTAVLTAGQGSSLGSAAGAGYLAWSAEL